MIVEPMLTRWLPGTYCEAYRWYGGATHTLGEGDLIKLIGPITKTKREIYNKEILDWNISKIMIVLNHIN